MATKFLNIEVKPNEKNKIILENIVKMLTNRKNILNPDNLEKNIEVLQKQLDDNLVFKIKSEYDNTEYYVKFYFQKLTTIKKITPIEDFLSKTKGKNKIIVINNINQKVYKQFMEYSNLEIFFDYELMINLVDIKLIPKHSPLNEKEKEEYLDSYQHNIMENGTIRGMSRMNITDPVARYYNMRAGDIVKIVRPSTTSGYGVFYRKLVPGPNLLFSGPK
ncbi:RNA polymerase Rpb5, C-terminal domain [seawater metagenome]|uniref:RNA polymerase Rpb5, C-terminal domain n=1 Tax=seawater metagenome TaxID=1561972 RepID=A0A5E8CJH3_9ZZZZ